MQIKNDVDKHLKKMRDDFTVFKQHLSKGEQTNYEKKFKDGFTWLQGAESSKIEPLKTK